MKNLKYLFVLAVVGMIFFSCNKDKKTEFTPEKAREALNQASDIILTYVEDAKGSQTLSAAQSASELGSSFKKAKKQVAVLPRQFKKFSTTLKHTIHRKAKRAVWDDGGAFNMADYAGTYNWNRDSNDWVYEAGNPANEIVVKFPATKASTTNNAVFTLHKYTEQTFTDSWGTYYQPTEISADLFIDGAKSMELNVEITYADNGDMVNHIVGSLFVDPFTAKLNFDLGDNYTITYSASIAKGESVAFSSAATLIFTDDQYEGLKTAEGTVQVANLKVAAKADIAAIEKAIGDSEDQNTIIDAVNANSSATIYTYPEENKIGDLTLKAKEDNSEYKDVDVIITYADGSSESAQPYFDQIQKSLEDLIDEIDGVSVPDVFAK